MFDFDTDSTTKKMRDIPITPILDMLVAIIFFLLLSTTFFELTNQLLPPSKTVQIQTENENIKPLAPKVLISAVSGGLRVSISWTGNDPGIRQIHIPTPFPSQFDPQVINKIRDLISSFKRMYPEESSIQLGLAPDIPYQVLVSAMDGILPEVTDIVLISYRDTMALLNTNESLLEGE